MREGHFLVANKVGEGRGIGMKSLKTKKEFIYIVGSAGSSTLRCDAAVFVLLIQ